MAARRTLLFGNSAWSRYLSFDARARAGDRCFYCGHSSIEMTGRYLHVTERGMQKVKSPLDNLKM